MGQRDGLVAAIEKRRREFEATNDPLVLLEEEAGVEARTLAGLIDDSASDFPIRLLLGWLHWHRWQHLADGRKRADLDAAVVMFAPCFLQDVPDEAFPERLLPYLARGAWSAALELTAETRRSNDQTLASAAVRLWRRIISLTAESNPDRGWALWNLSVALAVRFGISGQPDDLGEAVSTILRALDATPVEHCDHAQQQDYLRAFLLLRIRGALETGDPETTIDACRRIVAVTGDDDRDLPWLLSELSSALRTRAGMRGDMADLDAAVDSARRAASLAADDDPGLATFLTALSAALNDRFARSADTADLDDIIDAAHRLVTHDRDPMVRPAVLQGLGIMLERRFERTGSGTDLNAAIDAYREAAEGIPAGHPDGSRYLDSLLLTLWTRFERTVDSADLDAFIEIGRRLLTGTTMDDPGRPARLHHLGMGLFARHMLASDPVDLDGAIGSGQRAVAAAADGYPGFTVMLCKVSEYLLARFRWAGRPADVDAAITTARQAVAVAGNNDLRLPEILTNLSNALRSRHVWSGNPADLDAAVETARQAIEVASADHRERSRCAHALASALLALYQQTADRGDLDAALDAARQATDATPSGYGSRPGFLLTLSVVLNERFELTGDRANLDIAIGALREAVVASDGRMDQVDCLGSLVSSLDKRFNEIGELADLHEAIDVGRRALASARLDDPLRPRILDHLGVALSNRFHRTGDRGDLDAAIGAHREAVDITPADRPERSGYLHNLAFAVQARYDRSDDPADLDEAIELGRQAVAGAATDRDRALFLSNLAVRRQARFERTGDPAELDAAVETLRTAVACAPADYVFRPTYLNNLSVALDARFARTRDQADADAAVEAARAAVNAAAEHTPAWHARLHNLGAALARRFRSSGDPADRDEAVSAFIAGARTRVSAPSVRILSARAGATVTAESDPATAAQLLADAVALLAEVAPRSLARDDQQYLIGKSPDLAGDAAALALSDPSIPEADRPARALALLEAGRAILLGQALETRTDLTELGARHPGLAERFTELCKQLDRHVDVGYPVTLRPDVSAGPSPEARRQRADRFAALLAEIRAQPGFERFALPPTESQMHAQASDGPVVTINLSKYRCDALVLTASGITSVPLPDLGQATLAERAATFQCALRTAAGPAAEGVIAEILGWLWDAVTEPVLHALGHHRTPAEGARWPRVWWIPTGRLTSLPLHAAGHHADGDEPGRRTVMDRVVSSYTPTVAALHHARRRSRPLVEPDRSLIVAMPTTPGAPPLVGARAEATAIAGILPRPVLLEEPDSPDAIGAEWTPTRQQVEAALPGCAFAHFACHARSDPANPARSLLLLHDHEDCPFNVARIAALDLGQASLAYLSACETALTTTTTLLDEAIQLVSAFQLAGYPHVIGTLWPIHDQVAVSVATNFYACLRTADGVLDTDATAEALHLATRAIRAEHPRSPSLWAAYLHSGA